MAARAGGAPVRVGALRVTLWGALAMGIPPESEHSSEQRERNGVLESGSIGAWRFKGITPIHQSLLCSARSLSRGANETFVIGRSYAQQVYHYSPKPGAPTGVRSPRCRL